MGDILRDYAVAEALRHSQTTFNMERPYSEGPLICASIYSIVMGEEPERTAEELVRDGLFYKKIVAELRRSAPDTPPEWANMKLALENTEGRKFSGIDFLVADEEQGEVDQIQVKWLSEKIFGVDYSYLHTGFYQGEIYLREKAIKFMATMLKELSQKREQYSGLKQAFGTLDCGLITFENLARIDARHEQGHLFYDQEGKNHFQSREFNPKNYEAFIDSTDTRELLADYEMVLSLEHEAPELLELLHTTKELSQRSTPNCKDQCLTECLKNDLPSQAIKQYIKKME